MEHEGRLPIVVKNIRIIGLDYIRAISILLIVLYHWTFRYEESIGHIDKYPLLCEWGALAVNTFFIMTAFLTDYRSNLDGLGGGN